MNLIRTPRLVVSVIVVASLLPTSAQAYKHLDPARAWGPQNRDPIEYCIPDYVEDSLPGSDAEKHAYQVQAIEEGFAAWPRGAPCADISSENIGTCIANTGFIYDRENRLTWDDSADELEAGILGACQCLPTTGKFLFQSDGKRYTEILDCDIVFNNDVDWATENQITGGTCAGEHSLLGVATHEIGHFLGLGHSCDDGEACVDFTLRSATMFWTIAQCDSSQTVPNEDDRQGLEALYGRSAQAVCNRELDPTDPETVAFGVIDADGFELECMLESDHLDEVKKATWFWGDGETSEGLVGTHTYTTPGNFTLQVQADGESDVCGEWSFTDRKTGYVRSCGLSEPEFTLEPISGLTYQFRNKTDLSVYGCIYDVQWDVFDDGGTLIQSVKSWGPKFEFPALGNYRVVLNIGGPAGTAAAELTTEVKRASDGGGCDSSGLAPIGLIALIGLAGSARRRRS